MIVRSPVSIRALLGVSLTALLLLACAGDDAALDSAPGDVGPDADMGPSADMAPAPRATMEPASGSMAGYYPVSLDLTALGIDPATISNVRIGGVAAYDLDPQGDTLVMTVQGAPAPGPAAVELTLVGDDGPVVRDLGPIFSYDPPLDPRLSRIAAIGASLGQGVQRGVPSVHGTLMSPPAQVARHLGGHMPLPVPVPEFLDQMTLEMVGPAPDCETPSAADFIVDQVAGLLPTLVDPETRALSAGQVRASAETLPYNVSAGSSKVADVLLGPTTDLPARMLSHLVYEPETDPIGPVMRSQLDVLDEIAPDVIISVDLYGNDLINGLANTAMLDPDANSPLEQLHADLADTLERLAGMEAEVFIGDLPRPSVIGRAALSLARAEDPAERARIEEGQARIDADVTATNAELWRLAEQYPNIHVVALAERLDALDDGLILAGTRFDVGRFGGLIGLDGLHFTDTGYALVAEAVVDTMAATLDIDIPPMDLDAVAAADVENPDRLREAGFEPLDCLR